jgi:hypothetical protein
LRRKIERRRKKASNAMSSSQHKTQHTTVAKTRCASSSSSTLSYHRTRILLYKHERARVILKEQDTFYQNIRF